MATNFYSRIHSNPVIAAINNLDKLDLAIKSPSEIIFLLKGDIFNLKEIVNEVQKNKMAIYVHIDLMEGFSGDSFAVKYIAKNIKPDGIITTKGNLIKTAKSYNLFTIQRLFLLDSLSLDSGIKSINNIKPDAIEILPGIMHKVTKYINNNINIPLITGGLIKDKEDVIGSLKSGAIGISTSKEDIWYM